MISTTELVCLGMAACLVSGFSFAEDKALLVGIGDYQIKEAYLPGIDRDLAAMRNVALAAGFVDENIIVLSHRDATLANFRIVFQRELKRGVSASDRVLIYFSGHGTQVEDRSGDEADHSDEALLMYDTRFRYKGGKRQLDRVLLDDEIEDLLADIPAKDILVLVDACHSGTVTRYFDSDDAESGLQVAKSFVYEGMPAPFDSTTRALDDAVSRKYNYVALTASRDDQLAIATPEGSVFTTALATVVDWAQRNERELTLNEVHAAVSREIRRNVAPERLFTPQLSGDMERAAKTIVVNLGQ